MAKSRRRRHRISLWVCPLLFAGGLAAQNAPVALPCSAQGLAKSGAAYRVATPRIVYINCDDTTLVRFQTAGRLQSSADHKPVEGVQVSVQLVKSGEAWLRADLTKTGGGLPLEASKDYELVLAPDGQASVEKMVEDRPNPAPVAGPFQPLTVAISTKPAGTIAPSLLRRRSGVEFRIVSNVGLCEFAKNGLKFAEIGLLQTKIYHEATATLPPGMTVPKCGPTGSLEEARTDNPANYGTAFITLNLDHLRQASAAVEVTGLKNIFGEDIKLKNQVALGAVPKTKDAASWYLKFDHQAGPGATPGWVIDTKVAPQLGHPMWGGWFWKPALAMDIGGGTVSGVNQNDTITASLGLTRLDRFETGALQAVRFTPALSFETNREFNQQNLLADLDAQFDLDKLSDTRLLRAWAKYPDLKRKNPDLAFSQDLANWGAGVQFFLGSELGHALMEQTVKAAKSTTSVVVPTYAVTRLRPRMSAFAEYKRLTLTLTATPRYLFTTEYATRQSVDGKTIRLDPISGFRPYGEANIKLGLDSSGHMSLSTTYKLGSQPPTFVRANTVQSGFLLVY